MKKSAFSFVFLTIFAATVFLAGTTAMASTETVVTNLNINDIEAGKSGYTGGVQNAPPFSPFSVDLSVGDTFDYTINFLPGQQLTINNLSFIWAFSYANVSADVTGTGSLSLLDSTGAALYTSNVKTDTEGQVHFGQGFSGSEFPGLPTFVTFSGLHYVGTVDAYDSSPYSTTPVTTRTYNDPAFYFIADSYTTTSTVPEPASLLLLGTGIVGIGLAAWRKRK